MVKYGYWPKPTTMISCFPNFSKLSLDHRDKINLLTKNFAPYSDFNFTSLFSWNVDGSTEISILNDNLVIRLPDYLDGSSVYSILGSSKIEESLDSLLSITDCLKLVPEVVIDSLVAKQRYLIAEDRDSFDYIYNLKHLTELTGEHYKKKRNKHNVFVNDHQDLELQVRVIDKLDSRHKEHLKQVDLLWADHNSRSDGDIIPERKAIAKLLDNFSSLQLAITEVVVEGEIKAFSINELMDGNYTICHFEKALKVHHQHINNFLVIQVAKQLHAAGKNWMNWEQDLGLEGLRRSKLSYRPSTMLKKYIVKKAR